MRSIAYYMKAARFPAYKDLSGFDFTASEINDALLANFGSKENGMSGTLLMSLDDGPDARAFAAIGIVLRGLSCGKPGVVRAGMA